MSAGDRVCHPTRLRQRAGAINDVDTNNGKDLAGRIVWMPFRSAQTPPHALANFGVWFLNNYVKIYATYERFRCSGPRANENLILFRSQLAF